MELSLPSVEVEISGHQFEFTVLVATEARKVHTILLRTLGPAAKALARQGDDDIKIGDALAEALSALNEEDVKQIHDKLMRNSRVKIDGAWMSVDKVYDLFFAGKPVLLWTWCIEGLKANFQDFLSGSLQEKFVAVIQKK